MVFHSESRRSLTPLQFPPYVTGARSSRQRGRRFSAAGGARGRARSWRTRIGADTRVEAGWCRGRPWLIWLTRFGRCRGVLGLRRIRGPGIGWVAVARLDGVGRFGEPVVIAGLGFVARRRLILGLGRRGLCGAGPVRVGVFARAVARRASGRLGRAARRAGTVLRRDRVREQIRAARAAGGRERSRCRERDDGASTATGRATRTGEGELHHGLVSEEGESSSRASARAKPWGWCSR